MKAMARVFLNLAAALGFSRGPVLREEVTKDTPSADATDGFLGQFRGGRGMPRRRMYYLPKGNWDVREPEVKLDPIQRARVEAAEKARREAKDARRSFAWATTTATRKTQPERVHSPGLLPVTHARRMEIVGRRLARSERRAAHLALAS